MIGSRRCEVALEAILEKLNDRYVTHAVMHRLQDFRCVCQSLQKYVVEHDRAFALSLLSLCKHDALAKMALRKDKLPHDVYTHWLTCLIAIYRNTILEFKQYPTKRQVQNARINYKG